MTVKIAAIIPCYRVKDHLSGVVRAIGSEVERIYVVDDACPERSVDHLLSVVSDERVVVVRNETNQGVGGAVVQGYMSAISDGMDILVKIDGDNQMDPRLIPFFIKPILDNQADYTKGNRFYNLKKIRNMPRTRLFGNGVLSFLSKFSSGYWDLFDPTNGYTAIHASVANCLELEKISKRYFFESDMLFHLSAVRAVVVDVPMHAKYGDEASGLKISKIIHEFLKNHLKNFCKRIALNYYLRDMSIGSFYLPVGMALVVAGGGYGGYHWFRSMLAGEVTPAGTVMLSALPVLVGLQLVLAFLAHDLASVPRRPIHLSIPSRADLKDAQDG